MLDELILDERPDFYIAHRQKVTLDALKKGEIERVQVSQNLPVDKIAAFGLQEGFLQVGFKCFPDPRKNIEVPIDVMLLSQVLQRLNNEHSLLEAPKVMIYTATTFAILRNFEFLPMILKLKASVREKLAGIFENLNQPRAPI